MTKTKKLMGIAIVVLLLFSVVSLAACTDEEENMEINFSIGYTNLNVGDLSEHDLSSVVKTFDEWENIRSKRTYLSELDSKYTEQFFSSNSLIVYAFQKGWGINQLEIVGINKNGKELFIDIEINLGIMEVISGGIVIIEVKKADIAGANSLQIIEI